MIATFGLLLYSLYINCISSGITPVMITYLVCWRCAYIHDGAERGRRCESETLSRRNVSLVRKTEVEWRKGGWLQLWATLDLFQHISVALPLIYYTVVMVCSYTDRYVIKLRIQRSNLFSILIQSLIQISDYKSLKPTSVLPSPMSPYWHFHPQPQSCEKEFI